MADAERHKWWESIFQPAPRHDPSVIPGSVLLGLIRFFNNSTGLELSQGGGQMVQSTMDQGDHDFANLFKKVIMDAGFDVEPIAESLFAAFSASFKGQMPYFEDDGLMADPRWTRASMEMVLNVWGTLAPAKLLNVLPGLCVTPAPGSPYAATEVHVLPLLRSINNAIRWNAIIEAVKSKSSARSGGTAADKVRAWLTALGVTFHTGNDEVFQAWFHNNAAQFMRITNEQALMVAMRGTHSQCCFPGCQNAMLEGLPYCEHHREFFFLESGCHQMRKFKAGPVAISSDLASQISGFPRSESVDHDDNTAFFHPSLLLLCWLSSLEVFCCGAFSAKSRGGVIGDQGGWAVGIAGNSQTRGGRSELAASITNMALREINGILKANGYGFYHDDVSEGVQNGDITLMSIVLSQEKDKEKEKQKAKGGKRKADAALDQKLQLSGWDTPFYLAVPPSAPDASGQFLNAAHAVDSKQQPRTGLERGIVYPQSTPVYLCYLFNVVAPFRILSCTAEVAAMADTGAHRGFIDQGGRGHRDPGRSDVWSTIGYKGADGKSITSANQTKPLLFMGSAQENDPAVSPIDPTITSSKATDGANDPGKGTRFSTMAAVQLDEGTNLPVTGRTNPDHLALPYGYRIPSTQQLRSGHYRGYSFVKFETPLNSEIGLVALPGVPQDSLPAGFSTSFRGCVAVYQARGKPNIYVKFAHNDAVGTVIGAASHFQVNAAPGPARAVATGDEPPLGHLLCTPTPAMPAGLTRSERRIGPVDDYVVPQSIEITPDWAPPGVDTKWYRSAMVFPLDGSLPVTAADLLLKYTISNPPFSTAPITASDASDVAVWAVGLLPMINPDPRPKWWTLDTRRQTALNWAFKSERDPSEADLEAFLEFIDEVAQNMDAQNMDAFDVPIMRLAACVLVEARHSRVDWKRLWELSTLMRELDNSLHKSRSSKGSRMGAARLLLGAPVSARELMALEQEIEKLEEKVEKSETPKDKASLQNKQAILSEYNTQLKTRSSSQGRLGGICKMLAEIEGGGRGWAGVVGGLIICIHSPEPLPPDYNMPSRWDPASSYPHTSLSWTSPAGLPSPGGAPQSMDYFVAGFCESAQRGLCTGVMRETLRKLFTPIVAGLAPNMALALGSSLLTLGERLLAPGADDVGLHEGGLTWYLPRPLNAGSMGSAALATAAVAMAMGDDDGAAQPPPVVGTESPMATGRDDDDDDTQGQPVIPVKREESSGSAAPAATAMATEGDESALLPPKPPAAAAEKAAAAAATGTASDVLHKFLDPTADPEDLADMHGHLALSTAAVGDFPDSLSADDPYEESETGSQGSSPMAASQRSSPVHIMRHFHLGDYDQHFDVLRRDREEEDDDDRHEGGGGGGIGETDSDRLPSPDAKYLSRVRAPTPSVLIVGSSEEAAVAAASVEGVLSAFQATAAEIALAYDYAHVKCGGLSDGEEWVLSPEDVLRTIHALMFHDFTVTVGKGDAVAPVGIGSWIRAGRHADVGSERFDSVSTMMQGGVPDDDDYTPGLSEQAQSLHTEDEGAVSSNYVFAVYRYVYGDMSFADLKAFFAGHLRRDWGVDAVEQRLRIAVSLKRILGYAGSLRGGQDACDTFQAMANAFKAVGTNAVPAKRDGIVEDEMRKAYATLCKTVGEVTISYTTDSTMGSNFAPRYYPSNPHSLLYRELQNILAVKTSGDAGIFGDAWTAFMQFALAGRWYAHDRYAMVCLGQGGATTLPAGLLAQNFMDFQICAQSVLAGYGQKRIDEYYLWNPSVYLLPVMASTATDSVLRGTGRNLPLNYGSWFTCVRRESTRVLELAVRFVPETAKGHAIVQIAVGDARRLMASMDGILATELPELEDKTVGEVISLLHKFYSTFQDQHDIGDQSSMHHFVSGIFGLVFSKEFRTQLQASVIPDNDAMETFASSLLNNIDLAGRLAEIAPATSTTPFAPAGVGEYLGICGGVDMVTARVFPHLQYLVNVTKKLIESCLRVVRVTQDLTSAQMYGGVGAGGQDATTSRVRGETKQELHSEVLLNYSTTTACRFPGQALAACTAATAAATFVHAHNLHCVPASFFPAPSFGTYSPGDTHPYADLLPPGDSLRDLLPPGNLLPPSNPLPPGNPPLSGKKSRPAAKSTAAQAAAAAETTEEARGRAAAAKARAEAAAASAKARAEVAAATARAQLDAARRMRDMQRAAVASQATKGSCGQWNSFRDHWRAYNLTDQIQALRDWAHDQYGAKAVDPETQVPLFVAPEQDGGDFETGAVHGAVSAVYYWTQVDIMYAIGALGTGDIEARQGRGSNWARIQVRNRTGSSVEIINNGRQAGAAHWGVRIDGVPVPEGDRNNHRANGDCGPSAVAIVLNYLCDGVSPLMMGSKGGRRTLKTPIIHSNRTRKARKRKAKRDRTMRSK